MSIDIYIFLVSLSCALSLPFAYEGMNCALREEGWCVEPANCISGGKVIFKKNCLPSCPEWVHYYYNDTHTCYTECPEDSVVDRYSCLSPTTCTNKNQVVFNRSCVDACPVRSRYTKDGVCYSSCPKGNVLNGSQCVDAEKCTGMGYYVFNGTCVNSCPSHTPYIKYGTCLYTCTSDTVRNGNSSCITEEDCHKLHKVTYNGDCLESCPSQAPFSDSGTCSTDCPKDSVKSGAHCIDSSICKNKENKFVFADKCVSACPDDAPYQNDRECLKTCQPRYVSYGFECISASSCTSFTEHYRFIYNGSCIQKCPNDAPFIHERKCYSKCPYGMVANGSECIENEKCKNNNNVIFNGVCVGFCPSESPYENGGECVVKCPTKPYDFHTSYGGNGMWNGESGYMVVLNETKCIDIMTCTQTYGHFVHDQVCVPDCPADTGTYSDEGSPWHKICYSLTRSKIFSWLSSAGGALCLLVLVSMVYDPKSPCNEEEPLRQLQKNGEPPGQLETVVVEEEPTGKSGNLQENHPEDDQDETRQDFRRQPEVVDEDSRNVIVHLNRSCDDEIPLLTEDNNGARNFSFDEDDAYLFGNGQD